MAQAASNGSIARPRIQKKADSEPNLMKAAGGNWTLAALTKSLSPVGLDRLADANDLRACRPAPHQALQSADLAKSADAVKLKWAREALAIAKKRLLTMPARERARLGNDLILKSADAIRSRSKGERAYLRGVWRKFVPDGHAPPPEIQEQPAWDAPGLDLRKSAPRRSVIVGFVLFITLGLYRSSNAAGARALPLGTVTNVQSISCDTPSGAVAGASCFQAIVHCRHTDDINVAWALRRVRNPLGFIILTGSNPSSTYFGGPKSVGPFAAQYNGDGFSTAQIAWVDSTRDSSNFLNVNSGGGSHPGSTMVAACRQATITKYLYDVYDPAGIVPFGQQGHSEGSAPVLYTIVDYGLGDITKAAMTSASTPAGDYYTACTDTPGTEVVVGMNTSATSIFQPCSTSSRSTATTFPTEDSFPDRWNDTTTCQGPNRTPPVPYKAADLKIWLNASLANKNVGSLNFSTRLSHFDCPGWDNVPGIGVGFWDEVPTANITMTACGLGSTPESPAAEPYCTGRGSPAACCTAKGQGYCYCPNRASGGETYWTYYTPAGSHVAGPGFDEMVKQFESDLTADP